VNRTPVSEGRQEAAAPAVGEQLLVVAGEASGDLHGARLLSELRRQRPDLEAFGLGGSELRAAGLETLADSGEVAVVGITEVLRVLPRIRQVWKHLLDEVDRRRPQAALLIDFPDFNLRLARQLKRRGIPVVYYVSPQVWAWRRGRVRTIARRVDRMLVLFGFEAPLYTSAGLTAVHVGHPLVDEVPRLPSVWDRARRPGEAYRIALLPGSRPSEVSRLLAPMLATVRELATELPIEVVLIQAPTIPAATLTTALAEHAPGLPVEIVARDRFAAIAGSHLALCASGTATLEVGLLGTPLVVLYRMAPWSYALAKRLVRVKDIALVNLVLGRRVVPELLQEGALAPSIVPVARRLLLNEGERDAMRGALSELRARLGAPGASGRAAQEVAAVLAAQRAAPAVRSGGSRSGAAA
jgi:lipid-A-disaccharide synthase